MRETGDYRGWFMNRAVDFSHADEDPDDLVIGGLSFSLSLAVSHSGSFDANWAYYAV